MAKTEFLQIRLSPEDKRRIVEIASRSHLEASTWARMIILNALDDAESTPSVREDRSEGSAE